jgi:RNA polymerase sigma-70 factor (ECF subfamily)
MDDDVIDAEAEIERLAGAWQGGDRRAFEDLVALTHDQLRVYVAAFCESSELVDEVLQRTFITCFRRIDTFAHRGAFVAWLKAIARNHLLMHWRERQRFARLSDDIAESTLAEDGLADLEAHEDAARDSRRLAKCLERLPSRARNLIDRRYRLQRPLSEMAQHFKQPIQHLSVTLHRIRQSLRRCMESAS